jgi:5'-nucleotidase
VARGLLGTLAAAAPGTLLNLNVPDRPPAGVAGVRRAGLASFSGTVMAVAETGAGFVRTVVERTGQPLVPGTDLALLAEGYATVTELRPLAEGSEVVLPAQRGRRVPDPAGAD